MYPRRSNRQNGSSKKLQFGVDSNLSQRSHPLRSQIRDKGETNKPDKKNT